MDKPWHWVLGTCGGLVGGVVVGLGLVAVHRWTVNVAIAGSK